VASKDRTIHKVCAMVQHILSGLEGGTQRGTDSYVRSLMASLKAESYSERRTVASYLAADAEETT